MFHILKELDHDHRYILFGYSDKLKEVVKISQINFYRIGFRFEFRNVLGVESQTTSPVINKLELFFCLGKFFVDSIVRFKYLNFLSIPPLLINSVKAILMLLNIFSSWTGSLIK